MDTKLRNKLICNFRAEVFDVLEMISSKEYQFDYQEKVPIAHVSEELFNQWESCYQTPKNQEWYQEAFTETEHIILKTFDDVFEGICKKTPQNLPDIYEFIKSAEWDELSKAAKIALDKLNIMKQDK